jgi:putative membrane protein
MSAVLESFFAGFPILIGHFALTLAILAVGVAIYMWLTPYHELKLIKAGNTAAAVSLAGAVVGLALPLAFALAGSVNVFDILVWGVVTLIIQLAVYRFADFLLKGLPERIENDETGAAVLVVGVKLAVALLNAAAVAG